MSIDLMAPNGLPIVGTAEGAIGVAYLSVLRRDGEGIEMQHSGSTDGFYDCQNTVAHAPGGITLCEDSEGNWWRWDRLVPIGSPIPDPVPQPDVWVDAQPTITEALGLRAENAKLRALLAAARNTLAEWAVEHVWYVDDGEAPSPQHLRFMAEIAKALGE